MKNMSVSYVIIIVFIKLKTIEWILKIEEGQKEKERRHKSFPFTIASYEDGWSREFERRWWETADANLDEDER